MTEQTFHQSLDDLVNHAIADGILKDDVRAALLAMQAGVSGVLASLDKITADAEEEAPRLMR